MPQKTRRIDKNRLEIVIIEKLCSLSALQLQETVGNPTPFSLRQNKVVSLLMASDFKFLVRGPIMYCFNISPLVSELRNLQFCISASCVCMCRVRRITRLVRSKRVSNCDIPKKRSARVRVCSSNLGFSVGSANRIRPKHGIPLPV